MPSTPAFLYRNRYGIFCFQRRFPENIRRRRPSIPKFFRKSLRTKDRGCALRDARKLAAMLDALQSRYFDNENHYFAAIAMMQRYEQARKSNMTWENFEKFLEELDQGTDALTLLDSLDSYFSAVQLDIQKGRPVEGQSIASSSDVEQNKITIEAVKELVESIVNKNSNNIISLPIETAFDRFIEEKKVNWKANSSMEVVFRSEVFPLLLELTSLEKTGDINNSHVGLYKEAVLKLPSNRRKMPKYRELTVSEIIELDIPFAERLSPQSKKNYLDRLAAFLSWLAVNNFSDAGLDHSLKRIVKKSLKKYQERNAFTSADLKSLFNSDAYVNGTHDKPYKYWVPLLLLLTGARANEICQLHVSDVYKHFETGIDVLDINENEHLVTMKSLKSACHTRLVPIHPTLIKLGFLRYVDLMKAKGEVRIFPELPYRATGNLFGDMAERWFNTTYTNKLNCNILTPKTSTHSLRHNFVNYMAHELGAHEFQYAYAIGQTPKGGEGVIRYMKPSELIVVNKLFVKIKYEVIDFGLIKKLEDQIFFRRLKQKVSRK